MTVDAVVFDFDGLIIDSEWVIFESARAAFAVHGHVLTVEAWATSVGLGDDEDERMWATLVGALGIEGFELATFGPTYREQDRSNRDSLPLLPGDEHLDRLGLLDRFGTLVGADLVGGVGKPAPDVYLRACADLAADPARSVALEDSGHGVTAAKAAGMVAVAVPSRITRHNDLTHADRVVGSLEDVSLADLEAMVGGGIVGRHGG